MNITLTRPKKTRDPSEAPGEKKSSNRARKATAPKKSARIIEIGGDPRVDLLPPEVRAERRAASNVRRSWAAVASLAVVVLLGVSGVSLYAATAATELSAAQSQTSALFAQQQKYGDVRTVQEKSNLIKAAQSVGGSTEIDWNAYLAKVQATLPSDVTITAVSLDSASPLLPYLQASGPLQGSRIATVTFTASSPTLPSLPTWLDGLGKLPGFADATPGAVAFSDGTYTSTVTMHITDAAYSGRYTPKDK